MDIGVLTVPVGDRSLHDALAYLESLGVDAVELGCGGFPGNDHLAPETLRSDPDERARVRSALDDHGLSISALATHNNPLHPDEARATEADAELRRAIELADELGAGTVTCFSGLPGGGPDERRPNWVTAPWPPEHAEMLAYQWDRATDYWGDVAELAEEHGVDVAIEMHPNMLVHEPHGMERLRSATGERIGANFDPSHLYWQGIDPLAAVRYLGDAIHHAHAKDTEVFDEVTRTKGVLDTAGYDRPGERSWLFRTVGYGHGEHHWKQLVSALRVVGYDGTLSIEHEDALAGIEEGIEKAVDVLDRAVLETRPDEIHWAES